MRVMILAAAVAFTFATAVSAATPVGPFKLDVKGGCHAANGQFAAKSYCAALAPTAKPPTHCKDPKTKKFVKCGTPGAVPA
ncbi:MAG TPA: hypothetical protein VGI95_18935 [Caulobacteraceae bacterium]|jgi:hypothetical protein